MTHDYTRKRGVVHNEIMLPDHAPSEYMDRETLWNAVEKSERQHNAQTARDIDVALPIELNRSEQIDLMREYVKENFVDKGMCADFAIHDKNDGNPHAHIMLTMRPINKDGTWGNKSKKEYILDRNGERIKLKSGNWKSRRVDTTDWDKTATLEKWRENWGSACNDRLRSKGIGERIDHRTLEAQGIDREPTIHIGVEAHHMEKRGVRTERGDKNREIIARNRARQPHLIAEHIYELKENYHAFNTEISSLKADSIKINREMNMFKKQADDITRRAEYIRGMKEKLDELKEKRQTMGFFKSKKAIDSEIQQQQDTYEHAVSYFRRTNRTEPEQADEKAEHLMNQSEDKKAVHKILLDRILSLTQGRDKVKYEYNKQKLLADISPNKDEIHDELAHLEQEVSPKTTRGKLAQFRNQRTFDETISKQNLERILGEVTPKQAKDIQALRLHERGRVREFTRGR